MSYMIDFDNKRTENKKEKKFESSILRRENNN